MKLGKTTVFFLLALLFVPFQNCSVREESKSNDLFAFSNSKAYFKFTHNVVIEVFYEPGAEPFTGSTASGFQVWDILEENLAAIFQYRSTPPSLEVPKTLSQMQSLPAQNRSLWTTADILSLHQAHKLADPTSSEARFYVYFVNGHFDSGSGAEAGVIGVNLGGTPVLALFKDVVRNSGLNPNGPVAKFVEQSTLVHEMGHALGFVNNGVPMALAHRDEAHGAHTQNSECVMYWLNEGAGDLGQFVQRYLSSSSVVMWGPEVLNDAQKFSE